MYFTTVAAVLVSASTVLAQTVHTVVVGENSTLTYTPNQLTVAAGDIVSFSFVALNHTVTQSTFADPCTPSPGGVDTGFNQVIAQGDAPKVWNMTVPSNVTQDTPLWFFCAQTLPKDHCANGMVLALNAPTSGNKTFNAFQSAANATAANGTSTNSTSTNSTTPSGTGSSSSTSSTSTAPAQTSSNSAINMKAGAGAVLSGLAAIAGLML